MIDELTTVAAPLAPHLSKRKRRALTWTPPFLHGSIDVGLLLFLLLFLDVKVAVKIPALILAFLYQPAFSKKIPPFYIGIILLTVVEWLLHRGSVPPHYDLVAALALFGWILCAGAAQQVRGFSEGDVERTLTVFFLINILVSLCELGRIMWEIKALNPYLYQGMYQKYFIRTGDFIRGVTFDTSTTNALINAFGVVFFLTRRKGWMMLCCMGCLLLTGSNFTNLLLLVVMAWMFIFRSDRLQKGGIVLCVLMGVIFMGKVTPQNQAYVDETFDRWMHRTQNDQATTAGAGPSDREMFARHYMDSVQQAGIARIKAQTVAPAWTAKPEIPQPDINSAPYQSRADTTDEQRRVQQFVAAHLSGLPRSSATGLPQNGHVPGKVLALKDLVSFYREHPTRVFLGDGPGNFSSKLAFRATGLGVAGGYPGRWTYIHPDFLKYHLDLFLAYFSRPKESHSLVNTPDSVPGQLLGEYGLLGLGLFVGGYLVFFARKAVRADRLRGKTNAAAWPLLGLMAGAFCMGYWFEQLSIVVLFELMIYMDGV
ncbi:hypothetical protein [Dinghuibacter silviterrae]|uniref:O-antigen ligase-like membrane protein n=1 Tax=Dinghuibacter silviterrae TaxID=1539049 RepID=A0A4V3GKQ5_9BACT|nr:hypothetical protein [Dinghuibacter silviterrae]TDW96612.1 hypothetical protein EDB95_4445 [Dinghuibacter silviterrae]